MKCICTVLLLTQSLLVSKTLSWKSRNRYQNKYDIDGNYINYDELYPLVADRDAVSHPQRPSIQPRPHYYETPSNSRHEHKKINIYFYNARPHTERPVNLLDGVMPLIKPTNEVKNPFLDLLVDQIYAPYKRQTFLSDNKAKYSEKELKEINKDKPKKPRFKRTSIKRSEDIDIDESNEPTNDLFKTFYSEQHLYQTVPTTVKPKTAKPLPNVEYVCNEVHRDLTLRKPAKIMGLKGVDETKKKSRKGSRNKVSRHFRSRQFFDDRGRIKRQLKSGFNNIAEEYYNPDFIDPFENKPSSKQKTDTIEKYNIQDSEDLEDNVSFRKELIDESLEHIRDQHELDDIEGFRHDSNNYLDYPSPLRSLHDLTERQHEKLRPVSTILKNKRTAKPLRNLANLLSLFSKGPIEIDILTISRLHPKSGLKKFDNDNDSGEYFGREYRDLGHLNKWPKHVEFLPTALEVEDLLGVKFDKDDRKHCQKFG